MKRGTDHTWEIRKYKADLMLYAHCKCGYEYGASVRESPTSLRQVIYTLHRYCPNCGARKKWMTDIIRFNKLRWE